MGASEKFCLRWNDFESNISVSFRELRDDKDFFDITLACEEDQIQAHKVILSACSPFFRSVLKRNRHEHPLLYLKGVKFSELQAVLNFMYQGEVNVAQEDLNSFLAVAEELKVKGLTQSSSQQSPPPAKARPREDKDQGPPPSKRSRPSNSAVNPKLKSYEVEELAAPNPPPPVKAEPVAADTHSLAAVDQYPPSAGDQEYGDEYGEYEGGYEAEGGYDESIMDNSMTGTPSADGNKDIFEAVTCRLVTSQVDPQLGKLWICTECGKSSKKRTNIQCHVEVYHVPEDTGRYTCHVCFTRKGTYKAYFKHLYKAHRGAVGVTS